MSSYKFDTLVSKSEQEALKDMIFKRARERAAALENDAKSSYTTSAKNEIMDLARASFTAAKNPFSINEEEKVVDKHAEQKEPEEIIEAKRRTNEIRAQIAQNNKISSENIANSVTRDAMNEAREALHKKTSFMGALDFLNSQATISLVSKSGKKFDAIA